MGERGAAAGAKAGRSLPKSLARHIADELSVQISEGQLQPGERLSEEKIARRYGVSRGPVREALLMLAREELVVLRPRLGAFVIELSPEEIDEMFQVRAVLYALANRLFARRAGAEDLAELGVLCARLQTLADDPATKPLDFANATQAASRLIIARSGNRVLQAQLARMTKQAFRHYAGLAHSTAARRQETAGFAREALQAKRARDEDKAFELAWRTVDANRKAVLRELNAAADKKSGKRGNAIQERGPS